MDNILEPQVVFLSLIQKISLWAIGIPSRGLALFFAIFSSAIKAFSSDSSSKTDMKQFSDSFFLISFNYASVISLDEKDLSASPSIWSVKERFINSLIIIQLLWG